MCFASSQADADRDRRDTTNPFTPTNPSFGSTFSFCLEKKRWMTSGSAQRTFAYHDAEHTAGLARDSISLGIGARDPRRQIYRHHRRAQLLQAAENSTAFDSTQPCPAPRRASKAVPYAASRRDHDCTGTRKYRARISVQAELLAPPPTVRTVVG